MTRYASRLAAVCLSVNALTGCATPPPPSAPDPAALSVGRLVGLTPDQIRARWGRGPLPAAYVSEVRDTSVGRITVLSEADLKPDDRCPRPMVEQITVDGAPGRRMLRFIFLDGRLTEVESPWPQTSPFSPGLTPASRLILRCQQSGGEYYGPVETTLFAVLFAPWLAVGAAQRAPDAARRDLANRALEKLRLGAPPPGGLAVYAAAPPPRVTVARLDGADADLVVAVTEGHEGKYPARIRVLVRGGRVTEFAKEFYNRCELRRADFLRC